MIRCSSFNYVALLHSLLAKVSAHRSREWVTMAAMVCTTAAAMVHHVLLIYITV
jgi:hypothetical protein